MKKINIKKVLFTFPLILAAGIFLFIGWFIWTIVINEPPRFFPLNNPKARYTVIKSSNMTQGWDEKGTNSPDLPEPRYYVEYRGSGVFADDHKKNFFRVTVGKSKVKLEPFVDKNVVITKGRFASSSKQCIVDKCIDIYGPFVVLDIDKLKIAR